MAPGKGVPCMRLKFSLQALACLLVHLFLETSSPGFGFGFLATRLKGKKLDLSDAQGHSNAYSSNDGLLPFLGVAWRRWGAGLEQGLTSAPDRSYLPD